MPDDFTIAGLGARISTTIDNWNAYLDQNRDWLAGTADGGPEGDGRYPLTNGVGLTLLVACPAALADSVSGPAATVEAAKIAAQTAATTAASHAATAEEQADLAEAARVAVLGHVATAQAAATAAQGHAANAATTLANTVTLTNGLANAVALNVQNTNNIANAVTAQTALANTVTTASAAAATSANSALIQANASNAARIAAEAARDAAESIVTGDLTANVITTALTYTPANRAGDAFSGPVAINGAAGTNRPLRFTTGGTYRWNIIADNEPEIGTDAGSNFAIGRFNDAGTFVDTPFSINRQSGEVILTKLPYVAGKKLGYLGVPQNIQNGNAIIGPSDVGFHLYHSSATTGHTYTVSSNSGFNRGDAIVIINAPFSAPLTITGASGVTIYAADGTSVSGSKTLAACSSATLIYVETGVWMISGGGLS